MPRGNTGFVLTEPWIFLSLVGETPNDYVRRLRLEKAANMLINYPFRTITGIALECGFSGSAVFARAFTSYFAVSARTWRSRKHNKQTSNSHQKLEKSFKFGPEMNSLTQKSGYIEINTLPAYHIAYIQCGEGYNQSIGRAWKKLFKWALPRNLFTKETIMIGIPLDNPDITPQGKCRYQTCITVAPQTEAEGEVSIADIEAGKYAVYHFKGKQNQIKSAYSYLYGEWLPESGWEPKDRPALEIYTGPPQYKNLTYDICLPVKPLTY